MIGPVADLAPTSAVVTEHVYVFTATVEPVSGLTQTVAVVFIPHEHAPTSRIGEALIEHLGHQPNAHEIWFVTHKQFEAHLKRIASDSDLQTRLDRTARGFLINADGSWEPALPVSALASTQTLLPHDGEFVEELIASGLRQMFRDSRSLLTAHGGFHFGKPGGRHAKLFLRAQPAVARDAHAHFMAIAIMRRIAIDSIRRIWVDTAGIVGVAGAIGAIRATHFDSAPLLLVDSFGGYEGLSAAGPSIGVDDLVIISSSTSGTLAREVNRRTLLPNPRILTAYFLAARRNGASVPDIVTSATVCHLTSDGMPTRDRTYIEPFDSYDWKSCPLCIERHEPAVPMEGDGFLPVTGTVTPRKILASDSPPELGGLAALAVGKSALRVRHKPLTGGLRTVATLLGPLIEADDAQFGQAIDGLVAEVRRSRASAADVDVILFTSGAESGLLAARLRREMHGRPRVTEFGDGVRELIAMSRSGAELPRHILVVGAVASSGRSMLASSRSLRFLPETTGITYLVAVAHPESDHEWRIVEASLAKRSATAVNGLIVGWRIHRDRTEASSDAWARELVLLTAMEAGPEAKSIPGLSQALIDRLATLKNLDHEQGPKRLFLGSGRGQHADALPTLNRGFVFWNFSYPAAPTEEEIYWTITSVMQRNRWTDLSGKDAGRYMSISSGGHFFVIEPAMFDRFNDPVIQASVLRAAGPGELDYSTDASRSRYVADLIIDATDHLEFERGAAINEFLLSLALGLDPKQRRHLRIQPAELRNLLNKLHPSKKDLPPLARGLVTLMGSELSVADSSEQRLSPGSSDEWSLP